MFTSKHRWLLVISAIVVGCTTTCINARLHGHAAAGLLLEDESDPFLVSTFEEDNGEEEGNDNEATRQRRLGLFDWFGGYINPPASPPPPPPGNNESMADDMSDNVTEAATPVPTNETVSVVPTQVELDSSPKSKPWWYKEGKGTKVSEEEEEEEKIKEKEEETFLDKEQEAETTDGPPPKNPHGPPPKKPPPEDPQKRPNFSFPGIPHADSNNPKPQEAASTTVLHLHHNHTCTAADHLCDGTSGKIYVCRTIQDFMSTSKQVTECIEPKLARAETDLCGCCGGDCSHSTTKKCPCPCSLDGGMVSKIIGKTPDYMNGVQMLRLDRKTGEAVLDGTEMCVPTHNQETLIQEKLAKCLESCLPNDQLEPKPEESDLGIGVHDGE